MSEIKPFIWAQGQEANVREPIQALKETGWRYGDVPTASNFNWLFKTLTEEIAKLKKDLAIQKEELTQALAQQAQRQHHNICKDLGATAEYVKHAPQVHSVRDINALIRNPKKHEFVSTIVVDYQMEPIDGLELCKTIKDSPTSKIMLTGIASKDKAIEAHNAELIDFFVSKKDPQFLKRLNEAILLGTRKYFAKLSQRISGFYSFDNPLANPIVAAHLERELKEAVSYHTWIDFIGWPLCLRLITRLFLVRASL